VRTKMMHRKNFNVLTVIGVIAMVIFTISCIYPFIYMVLLSLTSSNTAVLRLQDISLKGLSNYYYVLKSRNFLRSLFNSVLVSVLACFFNNIISAMAAYGFAKKRFPGNRFLFSLFMLTLMVPGQVTLIPDFLIMRSFNMLNTYLSLYILIINAFGVFLVKQFMDSVPDELLEAAKVDGCPEHKIFIQIALPLLKPVLVSLTIFTFVNIWNSFLWPLVAVTKSDMYTLTVVLSLLKAQYTANYGFIMAGATVTFVFPFILYITLQKQFVEGIALSGVKG
jgi:multiple sugar transport system permease protein